MFNIPTAPIHKLEQDVLYHIFLFNANIFNPDDRRLPRDSPLRALTTTRYTSQVCRKWRSIILNSSMLWARLIDLDLLQQKHDHWRNEIMRRSGGTAPFWIRNTRLAFVEEMPARVEDFLLRLLDDFWDRVQNVEIFVEDWRGLVAKRPQLCLRPAPSLSMFIVEMSTYHGDSVLPPSTPTLRLFADDAPSIKEFCAPRMPVDLQAPWLSRLRKFTMFMPHDRRALFDALATMSALEEFEVSTPENSVVDLANEAPFVYEGKIHLPRLKLLGVQQSLQMCLAFLDCIVPEPGCSLFLDAIFSSVSPLTPGLISKATESPSIFRYFSSYLECHHPETEFHFRIRNGSRTMELFNLTESQEHLFSFNITCEDASLGISDLLPSLLSRFRSEPSISTHLNHLKKLALQLYISAIRGPLLEFLSSFSSVEFLRADILSIQTYSQTALDNRDFTVLFPHLTTLAVEVHANRTYTGEEILAIVLSFLFQHRRLGGQVKTIDVTACPQISELDIGLFIKVNRETSLSKVIWMKDGQVIESDC